MLKKVIMNYISILITCMISYWIGGIEQKYIYDEYICDCSKYNLLEYIDNVNYDLIIDNVKLKRDILFVLNLTETTTMGYLTNKYDVIYNEYQEFIEDYHNFKSVFVESFRELLDSKRKLYNNCIKK